MRYWILLVLLLSGCDRFEQPVSYAPCYGIIADAAEIRDCPLFVGQRLMCADQRSCYTVQGQEES